MGKNSPSPWLQYHRRVHQSRLGWLHKSRNGSWPVRCPCWYFLYFWQSFALLMSLLIWPVYTSYSNPIYLSSEKIRFPDSFSLWTALLHLDPFLLQPQCGHTCGLHGQVQSSSVLSTSFHADAFIPQSLADVLNSFLSSFFSNSFWPGARILETQRKKKLGERHMEFQKKAFELLLKGQQLVDQAVHRCGCGGLDTTGWFLLFPSCLSFSFDWDDRHLRYYEDRTTWSAQFSLGATMLF